jgi:hypothetical protein
MKRKANPSPRPVEFIGRVISGEEGEPFAWPQPGLKMTFSATIGLQQA